jgi:DNA replication protein DnaC
MKEELFSRARIPKNHWECSLAKIPTNASHLDSLIRYTENIKTFLSEGKGMYFSNQPGRGKSGAAAIVAKCAIAHRYSVLWLEASRVMEYKNSAYSKDGPLMFDETYSMYERAETCDLLILDELYIDLSKKSSNDYYIEKLLRTRIDSKRANVITSNMSQKALKDKYPMLHSVLSEVTEFVTFDPIVNFRPKQ